MGLTAYDIHNKEFKRSFRGYDVDEVNDFLDQIIKEFEILTREKLELEQQVEELQAEIDRILPDGSTVYTEPQQTMQPSNQGTQRFGAVQETTPLHIPNNNMNMQNNMMPNNLMQNTQQFTGMQPAVPAINAPAPLNQMNLSSMEQSIHKSIRVAQEVAEEVRINAKKEAELIVQEAEKNADRIINEALQKAQAINSELLDLKQKATVYRARFRTLVQSHLDILENSDWESLEELETNLDEQGKRFDQLSERSGSKNEQFMLENHQSRANDNAQSHNMNINMNMMDYQSSNNMNMMDYQPNNNMNMMDYQSSNNMNMMDYQPNTNSNLLEYQPSNNNMNMMDYQSSQKQGNQSPYQSQFQQQTNMHVAAGIQMPSENDYRTNDYRTNDFRNSSSSLNNNNDFRNSNDFRNNSNDFSSNDYRTVDESQSVLENVADAYLEEEEPRRELRRTSRKLKKKAMF
jgi:cell division initiation protein